VNRLTWWSCIWPSHGEQAFEELLHRYEVDLYITGHEHSYERVWPTLRNQVVQRNYSRPAATAYLITGAAGVRPPPARPPASLESLDLLSLEGVVCACAVVRVSCAVAQCAEGLTPWKDEFVPEWSAFRTNTVWGFSTLTVSANRLEWRYLNSADGSLVDSFVLTRRD